MMNEDDKPFRNIFISMWRFNAVYLAIGKKKNASVQFSLIEVNFFEYSQYHELFPTQS